MSLREGWPAGLQLAVISALVNKAILETEGTFGELDGPNHIWNVENGVGEFDDSNKWVPLSARSGRYLAWLIISDRSPVSRWRAGR